MKTQSPLKTSDEEYVCEQNHSPADIEVSTEKSRIMSNSTNNISADISRNGQLEELTNFKYLGATLCKDGTCLADVHISIAQQWQQRPDQTGHGRATPSTL